MRTLSVINPNAAAIDVGSEQLHLSIAGERAVVFGTVTNEVYRLRDYVKGQGVTTVAMEATGVYWLYAYGVLEAAGLEVVVVNGRHVRNLPGRKTDMADCQWLATLHAHGLLRGGFVPAAEIRRLQDYQRLRADHISEAASQVQKMQQALERMNVKFHDVISDLTGVSGMKVIQAILAGERQPALGRNDHGLNAVADGDLDVPFVVLQLADVDRGFPLAADVDERHFLADRHDLSLDRLASLEALRLDRSLEQCREILLRFGHSLSLYGAMPRPISAVCERPRLRLEPLPHSP